MKILIIEDNNSLLNLIVEYLQNEKHICEIAENYKSALEKISVYIYDIILLDIGLPDGNGIELIKKVKNIDTQTGIIIISARNSTEDKVKGLDFGADDYLSKPFELSELNSRIKAVLRRKQFKGENIIRFNEIEINTDSKSIFVNKNECIFTNKEYELMLFLIVNKKRVLTKEAIAEHLWQDNIDLSDNFDFIYTHLNNIRKKIRNNGGADYIKTLYGMGYKFTE
jgi:DNA-binding response OmpR family regulator